MTIGKAHEYNKKSLTKEIEILEKVIKILDRSILNSKQEAQELIEAINQNIEDMVKERDEFEIEKNTLKKELEKYRE